MLSVTIKPLTVNAIKPNAIMMTVMAPNKTLYDTQALKKYLFHLGFSNEKNEKIPFFSLLKMCGLFYKHVAIVNDASRVISE